MSYRLEGSCQCGAVRFAVSSHAPYPYQLCYCSICRKTAGGGGFAINLSADARTLQVQDPGGTRRIHHARMLRPDGSVHTSTAERHFCGRCGSHLWLFSPEWPELVHPLASAIDTELPVPPEKVHLMLGSKAPWVQPDIGATDQCFEEYPEQSIEEWHRQRGLWSD